MTAVASISTFAPGSSNPATTISVIGGKMPPDDAAVGVSDLALLRDIFRLVGHVPGESHDMVLACPSASARTCTMLRSACSTCATKVIADKFAFFVPANLAGDENLTARGGNAVGITFGRGPAGGLQNFEGFILTCVMFQTKRVHCACLSLKR